MEKAGPVFCAGITMFTPLKTHGADKGGLNVGIMGRLLFSILSCIKQIKDKNEKIICTLAKLHQTVMAKWSTKKAWKRCLFSHTKNSLEVSESEVTEYCNTF